MVELAPDVIVAAAALEAVAAAKATATIPIVVGALADPVELGLIKSYARPAGNVTGIMPYVPVCQQSSLNSHANLFPERCALDCSTM